MIEATVESFELPLALPFRNSQGVTTAVIQPLLALSEDGVTGHGSVRGAPVEQLRTAATLIGSRSSEETELIRWQLIEAGYDAAVRASIDMALQDLRGRKHGLSVRSMLGLEGLNCAPSALSLPVATPDETRQAARNMRSVPILKLKVTPETAIASVAAIRSVYSGGLRIDGNGSFTADQALFVAEKIAGQVELFEQPTPAAELEALARVHTDSPVPIAADESVVNTAAIIKLAGKVSCVNLKMLRIGGIGELLTAIGIARTLGLRVMLGSKLESSLGLTAIAQLAGLADEIDLDGSTLLAADFARGLSLDNGTLKIPSGPGLGCQIDTKKIGGSHD
ncbi:mandelate racemase/muconate lactonizing enzyme family protein [Psychromicrobium sp. YIM B11713]|uniref:mandelate racemase/muconate lactonizing enzyme family protein n=1 Tax=Psychromicrobium sp. YIM B11713 TaxID=3145233 RepID=UPI00374FC6A0